MNGSSSVDMVHVATRHRQGTTTFASSLLLPIALLWVVATEWVATTAAAAASSCNLECLNGSNCTFGDASFDEFVRQDGTYQTFHRVTNVNGMYCQCGPDWTGVLCGIPLYSCTGSNNSTSNNGTSNSSAGGGGEDPLHECYHGGTCDPGMTDIYGDAYSFCNCDNAVDATTGIRYVGKYCELPADATVANTESCGTDPYDGTPIICLNGGYCNPDPSYGPPCLCKGDFSGEFCEYEDGTVPDCNMPCQNGGYCKLGIPSLDEKPFSIYDDNRDEPNLYQDMYCSCPSEYDGRYCDVSRQPCGDNAYCYFGSTCVTQNTSSGASVHQCDCTTANEDDDASSYAGRYCQYRATSYCSKNDGMNGQLFCVNGGTCKDDAYQGCDCDPGYAGFSCEYVTELDGGSANTTLNNGNSGNGNSTVNESPDFNNEGGQLPVDPSVVSNCTLHCMNGGTCSHGSKDIDSEWETIIANAPYLMNATQENNMHCVCPDNYAGLYCEYQATICPYSDHVCFHGSTCVVADGGAYTCNCDTAESDLVGNGTYDFAGDYCEQPINDECSTGGAVGQPVVAYCTNGGTCLHMVGAGESHPGCQCYNEFYGPHCEYNDANNVTDDAPSEQQQVPPGFDNTVTDSCNTAAPSLYQSFSFCLNGGKCLHKVPPGDPHPGCQCFNPYFGPHCELHDDETNTYDSSDGSDNGDKTGLQIAVLIIGLIALLVVSTFVVSKYVQRRRRHQSALRNHSHKFWDNYRDHPASAAAAGSISAEQVNIAPRRQSMDGEYLQAMIQKSNRNLSAHSSTATASSSSDPFAAHLIPRRVSPSIDISESAMDIILDDEDEKDDTDDDDDSHHQHHQRQRKDHGDDAPTLCMGPPRDEDGHVLHSVEIL